MYFVLLLCKSDNFLHIAELCNSSCKCLKNLVILRKKTQMIICSLITDKTSAYISYIQNKRITGILRTG